MITATQFGSWVIEFLRPRLNVDQFELVSVDHAGVFSVQVRCFYRQSGVPVARDLVDFRRHTKKGIKTRPKTNEFFVRLYGPVMNRPPFFILPANKSSAQSVAEEIIYRHPQLTGTVFDVILKSVEENHE